VTGHHRYDNEKGDQAINGNKISGEVRCSDGVVAARPLKGCRNSLSSGCSDKPNSPPLLAGYLSKV